MGLYKCFNCDDVRGFRGRDFEGTEPKCPACGADARAAGRAAVVVVERALVHLDPPTHIDQQGKNHAACDEKLKVGAGRHRFTAEPVAVTCRRCKATDEYAKAAQDRGLPVVVAEADIALSIDPAAKTIKKTG